MTEQHVYYNIDSVYLQTFPVPSNEAGALLPGWRVATDQDVARVERAAAVPVSVRRRQGRLALLEVGKLDMFEEAIGSIEDPEERRAAQIEYEADTWERGNAFLVQLWLEHGGTADGLDELFILASSK